MQQSGGVLIAIVFWTAAYAFWVVSLAKDSEPNWLGIGGLWLWGVVIFGSIGAAVERMTNPRAGAWNGAGVGFLLVLFLAGPATVFALVDGTPPDAETLLFWMGGFFALTVLGAAAGALGGWIIQSDRKRRRRSQTS